MKNKHIRLAFINAISTIRHLAALFTPKIENAAIDLETAFLNWIEENQIKD